MGDFISPPWLISKNFERSSIFGTAVGFMVLTGWVSLCCDQAWGDQICGPAEAQYVEKLVAGMQQFAAKVTKTGRFLINKEYPGDGTEVLVVSFVDRGKTLFVHKILGNPLAAATMI